MQCSRCSGLMVPDHFFDLADDSGHTSFQAWRCTLCGNVVDPMILKNRALQGASPVPDSTKTMRAEEPLSHVEAA
jgi:hypothetical protein